MSIRAVALGIGGAIFICCFGYFNDAVIHQTKFVGNHLPISVYGALFIFVLAFNPLLRRINRRLALRGAELAVILAISLPACAIPGSGLMRTFSTTLMMPHQHQKTIPGWREAQITETAPPAMLADISADEERALNGFLKGLGKGEGRAGLRDIPWGAWKQTLTFWLPLVAVLWVALIGLALAVHHQWSANEQLPYPIATFTNALLPGRDNVQGSVLRQPVFWLGAAGVAAFHLNNYAWHWFPDYFVQISTDLGLVPLLELFPTLRSGGASGSLGRPIYFSVVGVAYFLASDKSLALGLGPFVFAYVAGLLRRYGANLRGAGMFMPAYKNSLLAGAFLGVFMGVLYTGRRYYAMVARRALWLPAKEEVPEHAVWGARFFTLGVAVFTAMLAAIGLDWLLAVLFTFGTIVIFLVMGRIMAETGLFFIQTFWYPTVIIISVFGYKAFGAQSVLIMCLLATVLLVDPREALMPFVVNSLKVLEYQRTKLLKVSAVTAVAVVIGIGVAAVTTLCFQYGHGVDMADRWATRSVATSPFSQVVRVRQRLHAGGALEGAAEPSGLRRLGAISPDFRNLMWLGLGLGLVLLFTWGRLRFPKWPIHPVFFLIWCSPYAGKVFALSFLVGWLVKLGVTKYGGFKTYQRLKPLMFGLIAGDMLGGILPIIIGLAYYKFTGEMPVIFRIMPG